MVFGREVKLLSWSKDQLFGEEDILLKKWVRSFSVQCESGEGYVLRLSKI